MATKETDISEIDSFWERSFQDGIAAGAPEDMALQFYRAQYVPYPWQWAFHAAAREADYPGGPTDIGLGGARGPGKSHSVLSQAALDDCQRVPGLKVLFLRQTGVSAQESFNDLISKAVKGRVEYRKSKVSLRFNNGSRILLGGFKDEKEIDKYIGIEYDIIIVEELTQITEEKYNKLRGSLRTSKANWRPRMYTSFNPGGIGHAWVRARYVLPHRNKTQTDTRFIPSTYKENPALNDEYTKYLESLTGSLGRAWREGNWDVFEGQYFAEWNYDMHVVPPFTIPPTWPRFRSIDPSGREGITSCHWYTVNSDGVVYVYREYYWNAKEIDKNGNEKGGRDYDQHARAIAEMSKERNDHEGPVDQESYNYSVIDTAAFAKAGYSETAAEIYEREGVGGLIPAAKERVIGWNAVHTYLRYIKDPGSPSGYTQPKLQVFSTCVNMIRTIPLLLHDDKHPEDVNSKGEDHAADELRYLLRTLREAKADKPLSPVERRLKAMRDRNNGGAFDYQYKRN